MPSHRTTWILPFSILAISVLWLALALIEDLPLTAQHAQNPTEANPLTDDEKPSLQDAENTTQNLGSALVASHLFGIPVLEESSSEDLPETELKLELLGTFASSNSDSASALVAEQNSESQRYFVGDSLPGGAELISVEEELVVIRRNHQDELLRLPRFGEIRVGPELSYPDRNVFLEQANRRARENVEPAGYEIVKDIRPSTNQDTANKDSLQDRLAALRERYSNPDNESKQ